MVLHLLLSLPMQKDAWFAAIKGCCCKSCTLRAAHQHQQQLQEHHTQYTFMNTSELCCV
jgi:hypothetical protein